MSRKEGKELRVGERRSSKRVPSIARLMSDLELAEFYSRSFLPLVRRASHRHGLLKEDARDVVQDAFLLSIGKLSSGGNPMAWMKQAVDYLSINLVRKEGRRSGLLVRWGPPSGMVRSSEARD